MKVSLGILAVVLVAAPAMAATYGWEDGGTILGSYGNLVNPLNVTDPVHGGSHALQVSESPIGGTPQAYVAFIEGLTDGDEISGSFWGWDDTEGASPSLRIWGHYAVSGDVTSFAGSASGSSTYTTGTPEDPWDQVSHTWTFDSGGGTRDALVIEARLYSSSSGPDPQDYWIDDIEVTTTSSTATITFPPSEVYGACCDGDDCTVVTADDCDAAGGEYEGDLTTCDPNPCGPTGSCCSADYTCTDDLTVGECAASDPGATWVMFGTCAVDCQPPTGSCCLIDGSCVADVTEDECTDLRGHQWTEGAADCDPACVPAVQAPVIISEYYESAPGSRKAIEIFNTSPEPVSLSGHTLVRYVNAATVPRSFSVTYLDSLTLGGFEALVFINNINDDIPGFDLSTGIVAPGACGHNGDDALGIVFGDLGPDTGGYFNDAPPPFDLFAVPGEQDGGPRGSDPYKDAAWERKCNVTAGVTEFDSCNFDGLKDCDLAECPRGTPADCLDGVNPDEWVFEGRNPYDDNGHHSLGVHSTFCLDVKPGSCPNSFNPGSHGVVPVGLMNADYVTQVDVSTVRLSRADGVGGEVAPHEGPPGPHSVFDDVATPFDGQPCDCHELTGDGIVDLSMKFKTDDVVATLGMFEGEGPYELVVTGMLLDGTEFSASDCIRIVPPPVPDPDSSAMTVQSNINEAWIDISQLDRTLDYGGFTAFVRYYYSGTDVTLTAESMMAGRPFRAWRINGVLQTMGETVIQVAMDGETTAKALYRQPPMKNPGMGDQDGPSPLPFER